MNATRRASRLDIVRTFVVDTHTYARRHPRLLRFPRPQVRGDVHRPHAVHHIPDVHLLVEPLRGPVAVALRPRVAPQPVPRQRPRDFYQLTRQGAMYKVERGGCPLCCGDEIFLLTL